MPLGRYSGRYNFLNGRLSRELLHICCGFERYRHFYVEAGYPSSDLVGFEERGVAMLASRLGHRLRVVSRCADEVAVLIACSLASIQDRGNGDPDVEQHFTRSYVEAG